MEAFDKVDKQVSKPVLGSDGASRWQEFAQQAKLPRRTSAAPKAPLKALDRASGTLKWDDERRREDENRQAQGLGKLETNQGYTQFKKSKGDEEDQDADQKKEELRIQSKTRPEKSEYFIPSKAFQGWKWDYIFTTRKTYGTGYYWDGTDSLLELQGNRQRPAPKHSSKKVATDKERSGSKETKRSKRTEDFVTPKKKKSKKSKAPVTIVHDPNHPLEQVAAVLQAHQLPPGWYSTKDPFSGKTYYYNETTGERSWEKPTIQSQSAATETSDSSGSPDLPTGWAAVKDPASGKEYYYHSQTRQTTWEKPTKEHGQLRL